MVWWINCCPACNGRWFEVFEDTNDMPGDPVHYMLKCTECTEIVDLQKTDLEESTFKPD